MKDLDYTALEKMTADEIENIRVEALKELDVFQKHTGLVEQEFLETQFKILDLQRKKKELEISLSKGKNNIRAAKSQIEILHSLFWKKRNG